VGSYDFFDVERMQTKQVDAFLLNVGKVGFLVPYYSETNGVATGALTKIELVSQRHVPVYLVGIPSQLSRADFGEADSLDFLSHDLSHSKTMLSADANWMMKGDDEGGILKGTMKDYRLAPDAMLGDLSPQRFLEIKTQAAKFQNYLSESIDPWGLMARSAQYSALAPILHANFPKIISNNFSKVTSNLEIRRKSLAVWLAISQENPDTANSQTEVLFDTLHDLGYAPFSLGAARTISKFGLCPDSNFVIQKNSSTTKAASEALLKSLFQTVGMKTSANEQDWCEFLK
jgi:hypothetical protein